MGPYVDAFAPHAFHFPKPSTSKSLKWERGTPENARSREAELFRSMYNLPSGGGGGNNQNDIDQIVRGVATIVGLTVFFISPLGSIFFAVTNSLFLLALLLPVGAYVAFNAWQFFNTIKGPCPNCGAPCQVLKGEKNSMGVPSLCLNCGVAIEASPDQTSIQFASGSSSVIDDNFVSSDSIFDSIFTNSPEPPKPSSPTRGGTGAASGGKGKQFQRERTVIDVEIEDE